MAKQKTSPYYVVCIGASAGGLNAINEVVRQLPIELNAAIFIVLHLSRVSLSDILLDRIRKNTHLPCAIASNDQIIKPGQIYIAKPDFHLLLKENKVLTGRGPAENSYRPSIDVLFRSAAAHFGTRTIGIVLTGLLNDGAVGMKAIQQSGGICVVQDPNEAEYPDMPLAVLDNISVDHCVSLKGMGKLIQKLSSQPPPKKIKVPPLIAAESNLSEKIATGVDDIAEIGERSIYSCPDCGGGLWTIHNGKTFHYRCHIGHSFSEGELNLKQANVIEDTLWVALRMMEERKQLLLKMARSNSGKGLEQLGTSYVQRSQALNGHIEKLKMFIFSIQKGK